MAKGALERARAKEAEAVTQAAKAKVVADLLQEMLASANPDSAKGAEYTVRQLLDEFSDKLGDQLKDQPEAEATIRATIGGAYHTLGLTARAEPHMRAALGLRRRLFPSGDVSVAQSLRDLAMNSFNAGDVAEAEQLAREAVALHRRLLGDKHLGTAWGLGGLADILKRQQRFVEAEYCLREAISIYQRHFAAGHNTLTESYATLAEVLKSQGKSTEIVDRERLAQLSQAVQQFGNDAGTWSELALAHAGFGEWTAVDACVEKVIELGRGAAGEAKYETADGCSQLGRLLRENAGTDQAEKAFRFAISRREPLDDAHARIRLAQLRDYDELCQLHTAGGRLEEALAVYEKLNALASETKAATGWEFYHAANQFAAMGHFREAATAFERSLEVDPSMADSYYRVGPLHAALGDPEGYHRVCHEMIERFADTDNAGLAQCVVKACLMVPDGLSADDFERVQKLAERAVTGTEKHGYYHYFAMAKGLADYRAGRYQDAIQWTLRWLPRANGVHWDASRFAVIAMAHQKLSHLDEAEEALASAQAIVAKMPDPAKVQPFGFYDWFEWLQAQLLCREAEELLKSQQNRSELIRRERLAQAIQSTEQFENDRVAWAQRAVAHARLGEWKEVDVCINKLIALGQGASGESTDEIADVCS